ncbi:MAG: toll/interleukin-1 receptor domain-containing protein [Deltaproteobacteria bacterium]|nr:toll/interleukin-1 receptor domain-containing protein [Deltaproteobacteria bacterium]
MGDVFISYSHMDKDKVQGIVSKIKDAGHNVWIDETKLSVSDTISTDIKNNIQRVDFVIVFLSLNSVGSVWVKQEIYESLLFELKNKKSKLIPCLIDECELPTAFIKSKKFNRIYENFVLDEKKSINKILSTLSSSPRKIFENEFYAILNIPLPGLEIYMPGETYGWGKNASMQYFETVDSYLLFDFAIEPYKHFKHFVLCEEKKADEIRGKLKSIGYIVTGTGDIDDETQKRRVWFKIKPNREFCNHPFKITEDNNQWIE